MADEIYNEVTNRLHSVRESESPKTNHIVSGADEVYDDVAPYRVNGHIDCTTITPVGTENPIELRWYERVNNGTEQSPQYEWIRSQDTTVDAQKTYGIPNGAKQSDINDQLYGLVADIDKVVLYASEYEQVTPQQGDNPQANGWYELSGSTYILTTDTTVVSGKNYYVRIAHISPDANKIINKENGYVPTAAAVGEALGANFVDNLTSTSTVKGLTANQGRVLNEKKANKNGWYEQFVAGAALSVIGDTKDTHAQFFYRETGDSSDTGGTNHAIEKGTATIEAIYGYTKKFNQLVQNGNFADGTIGWDARYAGTISVSDGVATLIAPTEGLFPTMRQSLEIISGHKYYMSIICKTISTSNTPTYGIFNGVSPVIGVNLSVGKNSNLFTASATADGIGLYFNKNDNNDYIKVSKVEFNDLTLIFGAGNEPSTVAEFEAWLTNNVGYKDYYDYTEGSLISLKPKKLISNGFNLCDEQWESGQINIENGQVVTNVSYSHSGFISCFPNTTYYSNTWLHVFYYDVNKTYIGYVDLGMGGRTFTTPTNAAYFRLDGGANTSTMANFDICINLSDPAKNGTYKPHDPYMPSVVDLSWIMDIPDPNDNTKKLFPYGLLSAGSVRDEITATKAIKRIGVVDLGTLNWAYSDAKHYFSAGFTFIAHKYSVGMLCPKYTYVLGLTIFSDTSQDKVIGEGFNVTGGGAIMIRDTSYTDAVTFKSAMSGVILYYELATPIVVNFDELDTHPMNYEVEPGGTEEFVKADVASGEKEPTSTALTANIIYPLDSLQAIRNLQTSVSTLSTNLATLKSYYRNSMSSLVSEINKAIEGTITSVENPADSGNYTFTYTAPASTSSVENESI